MHGAPLAGRLLRRAPARPWPSGRGLGRVRDRVVSAALPTLCFFPARLGFFLNGLRLNFTTCGLLVFGLILLLVSLPSARVRTNNDVEGWHCRLNDKPSHGQLDLQVDSVAVRAEAALVQLNVRLLSEGRAMRLQRKSFAALHSRE